MPTLLETLSERETIAVERIADSLAGNTVKISQLAEINHRLQRLEENCLSIERAIHSLSNSINDKRAERQDRQVIFVQPPTVQPPAPNQGLPNHSPWCVDDRKTTDAPGWPMGPNTCAAADDGFDTRANPPGTRRVSESVGQYTVRAADSERWAALGLHNPPAPDEKKVPGPRRPGCRNVWNGDGEQVGVPPVDNAHVEAGCERFSEARPPADHAQPEINEHSCDAYGFNTKSYGP